MSVVSVIVPVYKVEKYICRCIESVLNQTFSNFVLILVDDGSSDNCSQICDEYATKNPCIQVIHKQNGGLSDARNYGIELVLGNPVIKWITFIDGDDWVFSKYLESLYNGVVNYSSSLSICAFDRTDGKENKLDEEKKINEQIIETEKFYCDHYVNANVAWGKLFTKEDFLCIRFPVGRIHEDEFTTYKILLKYRTVTYISNTLYKYYNNETSIINSSWTIKKFDAIDAFKEKIKYFYNNNYITLGNYQVRHTLYHIYLRVKEIKETTNEKYAKRYLREFRNLIRIARKNDGFPIKDNIFFYEFAYPKMIKLYYFKETVKNKIVGVF